MDLDADTFGYLRQLIYRTSGICITEAKTELLKNRLQRRLRALGLSSFRDYASLLRGDGGRDEIAPLLDAVSTNYTFFFREAPHFDLLRHRVLPALVAAKEKEGHRKLRLWSAGCSTGEEPYSIAMTVADAVDLGRWDVRILATDLNREVLARAAAGVYPADRLKGVPAELAQRHFARTSDGSVRVAGPARSLVTFRGLNLMDEPFPFRGPFDVIFCRNVMIYFDRPTQTRLVDAFYRCTAPGGHLFIGHSESLTTLKHRFVPAGSTVYRRA